MYLSNAFSLSMLPFTGTSTIETTPIGKEEAVRLLGREWKDVVGHTTTAYLFSHILEVPVETNRVSVALKPGDEMVVGQYSGPRLPEGATELPEGASIKWILVQVKR